MGENLMGETCLASLVSRLSSLVSRLSSLVSRLSSLVSSLIIYYLFILMKLLLISEVIGDPMIIQNNQNLFILKNKIRIKFKIIPKFNLGGKHTYYLIIKFQL